MSNGIDLNLGGGENSINTIEDWARDLERRMQEAATTIENALLDQDEIQRLLSGTSGVLTQEELNNLFAAPPINPSPAPPLPPPPAEIIVPFQNSFDEIGDIFKRASETIHSVLDPINDDLAKAAAAENTFAKIISQIDEIGKKGGDADAVFAQLVDELDRLTEIIQTHRAPDPPAPPLPAPPAPPLPAPPAPPPVQIDLWTPFIKSLKGVSIAFTKLSRIIKNFGSVWGKTFGSASGVFGSVSKAASGYAVMPSLKPLQNTLKDGIYRIEKRLTLISVNAAAVSVASASLVSAVRNGVGSIVSTLSSLHGTALGVSVLKETLELGLALNRLYTAVMNVVIKFLKSSSILEFLTRQIEKLAITIENIATSPHFNAMIKQFESIAKKVWEHIQPNLLLIAGVIGGIALIVPAAAALAPVFTILSAVIGVLTSSLGVIIGMLGTLAGVLTGLVAAGLTLMVSAVSATIAALTGFTGILLSAIGTLGATVASATAALFYTIGTLAVGIPALISGLAATVSAIIAVLSTSAIAFGAGIAAIAIATAFFSDALLSATASLQKGISDIVKSSTKIVGTVKDFMIETVSKVGNVIADIAMQFIQPIKALVVSLWGTATAWYAGNITLSEALEETAKAFKTFSIDILKAFSDLYRFIKIDGTKIFGEALQGMIKGVKVLSKVMFSAAEAIYTATNSWGNKQKYYDTMADIHNAGQNLEGTLNNLSWGIRDTVNDITADKGPDIIESTIAALINKIQGVDVSGLFKSVKDKLAGLFPKGFSIDSIFSMLGGIDKSIADALKGLELAALGARNGLKNFEGILDATGVYSMASQGSFSGFASGNAFVSGMTKQTNEIVRMRQEIVNMAKKLDNPFVIK